MYLSLDWIKQYVDLDDLDPDAIALKLTMATAEVEGVETLNRCVKDILVGEIVAVEPIENKTGKIMNYATVDIGGRTVESVCGAPNAAVGVKTAVALPGTAVAEGLVVKEREVYGKMSRAMLLSPLELGWGDSHVGIMEYPAMLENGSELADLVPAVDHIIEIDNKSITHRPDLWGHYGFAREFAAIYGRELKPLALADESKWSHLPVFPLKIEDYEGCPGYCCLDIDNIQPDFAPLFMQYHLLAIGLRPINLLVDLTNYIMCELGQPMHAFNGDRVRDVIVAPFGSNGTFRTLDSIVRDMLPEDLMINDKDGPIALAGIMGGEESEIVEGTTRMLLESANFNPSRIRRTATRLNMRSDASLRFEKGQPPYHMEISIKRFVQLLEDAGQKPQVMSQLTCDGDDGSNLRTISMKADYVTKTIGMEIPEKTVVDILESLEFKCSTNKGVLDITVPPHRSAKDISIPNDIVEEVARVYGYDNIEPSMPSINLIQYRFNRQLQKEHKIRRFLSISRGFNEAYTYSWYDDVWLQRLGYDPGECLELLNPAAEQSTRMRKNIIPNLLALIESNASSYDRFCLYELGNIHLPDGKSWHQGSRLSAVAYQSMKLGSLQDFFLTMKRAVEEIFSITNSKSPVFTAETLSGQPWSFENASLAVSVDGRSVGSIGYFTGKMFEVFDKDIAVVWFELDLDAIKGVAYPEVSFEPLPVYPGSWMDFSIVANNTLAFDKINEIVYAFKHEILKRSKFLYRYSGKGLDSSKISYTFRFRLGLKDRTLTGDDLNAFRAAFIEYLEKNDLELR